MVGLGVLMATLGALGLYARWRDKLYSWRVLHRFALVMAPSGLVAVLAGWITTEVGRQPWTVTGLLRTASSVSPLAAPAVATSLVAFVVVYFAVFGAGIAYILRLMAMPPHAQEPPLPNIPMHASGLTPGAAALPAVLAAESGPTP
jgi:cytochrome d ubiquinol oxidase subunit I